MSSNMKQSRMRYFSAGISLGERSEMSTVAHVFLLDERVLLSVIGTLYQARLKNNNLNGTP